jgi:hypothetical protein
MVKALLKKKLVGNQPKTWNKFSPIFSIGSKKMKTN